MIASPRSKRRHWVSSGEAEARLGVSRWTLLRRRPEFTLGVHYRSIGKRGAGRPTYQYCLDEIERFWGLHPTDRVESS